MRQNITVVVVDDSNHLNIKKNRGYRVSIENIGVHYVAASLKRDGYNVVLYRTDCVLPSKAASIIQGFNPQFVLFGPYTCNLKYTLDIATNIKNSFKKNPPVIAFGGYHAPFCPDDIPPALVDFILTGNGEISASILINSILKGTNMPRIITLPKLSNHDIQSLPWPYRDPLLLVPRAIFFPPPGIKKPRVAAVVGSRGCISSCEFCLSSRTRHVQREPDDIVSEMCYLQDIFKIDLFHFVDPLFNANPKWVEKLCGSMLKTGRKFYCSAMPDFNIERNMVQTIRSAGFYWLLFGLEVLNNSYRKKIGKRKANAENAFKICFEEGVLTRAFIILGMPNMNEKDINGLFEISDNYPHIGNIRPNFATPFPGTVWWDKYSKENLITKDYSQFTTEVPVLKCAFSASELVEFRHRIQKSYYENPKWKKGALDLIHRFPELKSSYENACEILVQDNVANVYL